MPKTQGTMNKLKTRIIHWLGGYTREEERQAYTDGNHDMCVQIREKAKELNGMDPVDWCNSMWLYLTLTMKDCKDRLTQEQ